MPSLAHLGAADTGGLVRLVDYDPGWPQDFAQEAARVRAVLGGRAVAIEHVGSTSVPGLSAKPIIDMLVVVVDSADEESHLPLLQAAGYLLRIQDPAGTSTGCSTGPTARSTCTSSPSAPPRSTGFYGSVTSCGATLPTVTFTPPRNGGSPAGSGKTCKATPTRSPTSSRRSWPGRNPARCLNNGRLRDKEKRKLVLEVATVAAATKVGFLHT